MTQESMEQETKSRNLDSTVHENGEGVSSAQGTDQETSEASLTPVLQEQIADAMRPVLDGMRKQIAEAVEQQITDMSHDQVQQQVDEALQPVQQRLDQTIEESHQRAASPGVQYKRVNLNLSPSAYRELQALANEKGKSISDVIREAIILSRWFYDITHERGSHLLVEHEGKIREIVPIQ